MSTLYAKTMELLEASDLSLREISDRADLPYDWLTAIKYDRIKNPSVNRIQQLYEFLTGNNLSV